MILNMDVLVQSDLIVATKHHSVNEPPGISLYIYLPFHLLSFVLTPPPALPYCKPTAPMGRCWDDKKQSLERRERQEGCGGVERWGHYSCV